MPDRENIENKGFRIGVRTAVSVAVALLVVSNSATSILTGLLNENEHIKKDAAYQAEAGKRRVNNSEERQGFLRKINTLETDIKLLELQLKECNEQ